MFGSPNGHGDPVKYDCVRISIRRAEGSGSPPVQGLSVGEPSAEAAEKQPLIGADPYGSPGSFVLRQLPLTYDQKSAYGGRSSIYIGQQKIGHGGQIQQRLPERVRVTATFSGCSRRCRESPVKNRICAIQKVSCTSSCASKCHRSGGGGSNGGSSSCSALIRVI